MAKVYGLHTISLKPGANAEDFEKFVVDEVYPLFSFEGLGLYLLKGDRGEREGKYLWVFEVESVETRNRLFPSPGDTSEETAQLFDSIPGIDEMAAKWDTFATPISEIYTDYVVVGK